jgi:hypothetical protein
LNFDHSNDAEAELIGMEFRIQKRLKVAPVAAQDDDKSQQLFGFRGEIREKDPNIFVIKQVLGGVGESRASGGV